MDFFQLQNFKHMRNILFKNNSLYFNLFLSLGFALLLLAFRIKITHTNFYLFLVWNLFLAGIPFAITQYMKWYRGWQTSVVLKSLLFITWLLFLPNSPYIITDLIHLHDEDSILIWLDLFLVFVFALNGLLFGILSLFDMYGIIRQKYSSKITSTAILLICILTGYGIYLGRFLRFNSWDIISRPKNLFVEILHSLGEPKVWAITFAFGGLLWILFLVMKSVKEIRLENS